MLCSDYLVIPFSGRVIFRRMDIHVLFIHSSSDGHLGCSHLLSGVNSLPFWKDFSLSLPSGLVASSEGSLKGREPGLLLPSETGR